MALQDDYQVKLSNFEGPLDLLLFLIRRAEVDINDIPIVSITEQYFELLREIDAIDIEERGTRQRVNQDDEYQKRYRNPEPPEAPDETPVLQIGITTHDRLLPP